MNVMLDTGVIRMTRYTGLLASIAILILTASVAMAAQNPLDSQQALRARIEQRYDVVPLTDAVALRPKSRIGDVRLIEVSDTIAINGVPVTGRELRQRVGDDADAILRLSYLDASARRALFEGTREQEQKPAEMEPRVEQPPEAEHPSTPGTTPPRSRRSSGDRVRIFGDVTVSEDEEVSGQAVAVMGSVHIDGKVNEQVVAVLGSVDLGPHAVVRGDVVTVGGRLRRAPGAQVGGAVTEVSLGGGGVRLPAGTWFDGWGPIELYGFSPVARLLGSTFRFVLLALLSCAALVVARRPVEGAAERVVDNPVKATLVGLAAWILFAPVLFLTAIVLAMSIVGIPLLLLLPFAVLVLLLMALVGFSGTAYAVGQWMRRRLGIGTVPPFVDVCLGVLVILLPLLLGRVVSLALWPVNPIAFLLIAAGLAVECLAWASGFGAVLTNTFGRWQARRAARAAARAPVTP
jgi:hypothetical protein